MTFVRAVAVVQGSSEQGQRVEGGLGEGRKQTQDGWELSMEEG